MRGERQESSRKDSNQNGPGETPDHEHGNEQETENCNQGVGIIRN